ncbi:MAG: hypothetical protein K0B11_21615 [Mariniphaga sp.]|nr:hypothetical protein [Mariniphaga sp.]
MKENIKFNKQSLIGTIVSLIITMFIFTNESCASDNFTPIDALITIIQSIQANNVEKTFDLDYSQQRRISGKFKHEIAAMKTEYGKYFEGNPSICPRTYGSVPCDGEDQRNIVTDIRLFIPETSNYEISEIVYSNDEKTIARILVKVNYSIDNHLIYVNDLKAIQIYKGGITPIPPAFRGYGILTAGNSLLSVRECGGHFNFPFQLSRKDIKVAISEIRSEKVEKSWLIRDVEFFKDQFSFY